MSRRKVENRQVILIDDVEHEVKEDCYCDPYIELDSGFTIRYDEKYGVGGLFLKGRRWAKTRASNLAEAVFYLMIEHDEFVINDAEEIALRLAEAA